MKQVLVKLSDSGQILPKKSSVSILLGVYFFLFSVLIVAFKIDVSVSYAAIVTGCLLTSLLAIYQSSFLLLFYVQCLLFALVSYQIQSTFGVAFLVTGGTPTELTMLPTGIMLAHLAALSFGSILVKSSPKRATHQVARPTINFFLATLVLIFFFLFAMSFLGINRFVTLRSTLYASEITSKSYATLLEFVVKLAPFLLASAALLEIRYKRKRKPLAILAVLLILLGLVISNPSNTPRFISLTGLLIVFFAFFVGNGKIYITQLMILYSPLVFAIILPITSLLRGGLDQLTVENAVRIFSSLEFSSFVMFLDSVNYFRENTETTSFFLSAVAIIVPHTLIPWKEAGLGLEVAGNSGYTFHNAAVPSFFNSYVDFGFVGLIAFSLALGVLFARLDSFSSKFPSFASRKFAYWIIVVSLMPIFARGDMSTAMISFYSLLISYEVIRFLIRLTILNSSR